MIVLPPFWVHVETIQNFILLAVFVEKEFLPDLPDFISYLASTHTNQLPGWDPGATQWACKCRYLARCSQRRYSVWRDVKTLDAYNKYVHSRRRPARSRSDSGRLLIHNWTNRSREIAHRRVASTTSPPPLSITHGTRWTSFISIPAFFQIISPTHSRGSHLIYTTMWSWPLYHSPTNLNFQI